MNIRKIVRAALWIVLPLFILSLSLLTTVDRDRDAVNALFVQAQDSIQNAKIFTGGYDSLKISYGSVDITPDQPMPMAGYSPRNTFDSIHDPLNIKILALRQGTLKVYMLSADLLLFPPLIADKIRENLQGNEHVYFSASHTHSAIGGWDKSIAGQFAMGDIKSDYWNNVAQKVLSKMRTIQSQAIPGTLEYFESKAPFVKNRLSPGDPVDSYLRGIRIKLTNGDSAVLYSYSGHTTLISRNKRIISADYPGAMATRLQESGYSFSMFMAGAMGSHSITNIPGKDFNRVNALADSLQAYWPENYVTDSLPSIAYMRVNLPLGKSQLRISSSLALRNWVFENALGPLEAHMSFLKIGEVVFVSTSCDFSGELIANQTLTTPETPVIITSFNGDYVGYITADQHYDHATHAEVRTMNWVGPYFGEYFSNVIMEGVKKIAP